MIIALIIFIGLAFVCVLDEIRGEIEVCKFKKAEIRGSLTRDLDVYYESLCYCFEHLPQNKERISEIIEQYKNTVHILRRYSSAEFSLGYLSRLDELLSFYQYTKQS